MTGRIYSFRALQMAWVTREANLHRPAGNDDGWRCWWPTRLCWSSKSTSGSDKQNQKPELIYITTIFLCTAEGDWGTVESSYGKAGSVERKWCQFYPTSKFGLRSPYTFQWDHGPMVPTKIEARLIRKLTDCCVPVATKLGTCDIYLVTEISIVADVITFGISLAFWLEGVLRTVEVCSTHLIGQVLRFDSLMHTDKFV